jgi:hypothetical protein
LEVRKKRSVGTGVQKLFDFFILFIPAIVFNKPDTSRGNAGLKNNDIPKDL